MTRETFVTIVNELDTLFNEIIEGLEKLGFMTDGNPIVNSLDAILEAIEEEMDPDKLVLDDKYCYDCGSFLCEWLFGNTEFNEICPDAGALWDYILDLYKKRDMGKYASLAMGENLKED